MSELALEVDCVMAVLLDGSNGECGSVVRPGPAGGRGNPYLYHQRIIPYRGKGIRRSVGADPQGRPTRHQGYRRLARHRPRPSGQPGEDYARTATQTSRPTPAAWLAVPLIMRR